MTTPDTLSAADRRRAATLLLACLDDDGADQVNAVLEEASAAPGGVQGLIVALATATLEVLIGAVGEGNARATLNLQVLNAEMDSGVNPTKPHPWVRPTNPSPSPSLKPEQTDAPEPDEAVADTIRRSWDDRLWYRSLPYRGRP